MTPNNTLQPRKNRCALFARLDLVVVPVTQNLRDFEGDRAVFLDVWEKEGKRPEDAEIFILREVYADEDTPRVKEVAWKIMLKANQNTFSVRR